MCEYASNSNGFSQKNFFKPWNNFRKVNNFIWHFPNNSFQNLFLNFKNGSKPPNEKKKGSCFMSNKLLWSTWKIFLWVFVSDKNAKKMSHRVKLKWIFSLIFQCSQQTKKINYLNSSSHSISSLGTEIVGWSNSHSSEAKNSHEFQSSHTQEQRGDDNLFLYVCGHAVARMTAF